MAKREMKTVPETTVEEEVDTTPETTVEEEVDTTPETTVEEDGAVEPENECLNGTVIDCKKLNVRKKPNAKADVICVVNVGSKLTIDEKKSTKEWYKVTTEDNTQGFCMKKYIKVN